MTCGVSDVASLATEPGLPDIEEFSSDCDTSAHDEDDVDDACDDIDSIVGSV